MTNPLNHVTLTGRLARELHAFPKNSDGSQVFVMTLAVNDNFQSGPERKAQAQMIETRIFLAKNQVDNGTSWDRVHTGDLIAVNARLACRPYEKDGKTVYPPITVEIEGFPQFLEPKSVVDARAAKRAVDETPVPANETPEQELERLRREVAAARAGEDFANTDPFAS